MDLKPVVHKTLAILFFFVVLFVYTKIFGPIPFFVNLVATSKTDSFSVTGEGQVTAVPDIAVIHAGVAVDNAQTIKSVQDQLNSTVNKVTQAIKNLGVDEKDLQTSNYNINPQYEYLAGLQRLKGYSGSTNLTIKARQIDKANAVLDVVTAAGANVVGGVNFEVGDKQKYENEAREKAVKQAKDKAVVAAKIAGFSLGKVINYTENSFDEPRPVMLEKAIPQGGSDTNLEPGSNQIKVSVSLSYEVR